MPTLQRRQSPVDLRKAAHDAFVDRKMHSLVRSNSQASSDDGDMDLQTPKQLHITAGSMPTRYESDEESVSPIPDEFEDARTSFSDVELDESIDLDDDEIPSVAIAISVPVKSARPLLVNVSKLAPMEKRSTAAHVRPHLASNKTTIGRPVVARAVNGKTNGPAIVTLSKPPSRGSKAAPPVPARSGARTSGQASVPASVLAAAGQRPTFPPTEAATQRPSFPPRKDSHASRPSISTVASTSDDDRSSVAGSSSSSAPSSVADDDDMAARDQFISEDEMQHMKYNVSRSHDEDLERAISDYMTWRAEGSPGEPSEEAWQAATAARMQQYSPTQQLYAKTTNGRENPVCRLQEEEDEDWKREIEHGLATPTPTTYAAYDPFNIEQPTLRRQGSGLRQPANREEIPRPSGPMNGLRRGFGMVRRNL